MLLFLESGAVPLYLVCSWSLVPVPSVLMESGTHASVRVLLESGTHGSVPSVLLESGASVPSMLMESDASVPSMLLESDACACI